MRFTYKCNAINCCSHIPMTSLETAPGCHQIPQGVGHNINAHSHTLRLRLPADPDLHAHRSVEGAFFAPAADLIRTGREGTEGGEGSGGSGG